MWLLMSMHIVMLLPLCLPVVVDVTLVAWLLVLPLCLFFRLIRACWLSRRVGLLVPLLVFACC